MNEVTKIESLIYEVRGVKVMIDRDLAMLYGVETRALNQAVKRNHERFPDDFMFQMTKEELQNWKSQIVTSNSIKMGLRRPPYVFTELGVAMLSSILHSKVAIDTNIKIMRTFVALRSLANSLPVNHDVSLLRKDFEELKSDIQEILHDQNDINEPTRMHLNLIDQALAELQIKHQEKKKRNKIGFVRYDE